MLSGVHHLSYSAVVYEGHAAFLVSTVDLGLSVGRTIIRLLQKIPLMLSSVHHLRYNAVVYEGHAAFLVSTVGFGCAL